MEDAPEELSRVETEKLKRHIKRLQDISTYQWESAEGMPLKRGTWDIPPLPRGGKVAKTIRPKEEYL